MPPENAVEFAAVINEVGRIRRRDGARAWSICQDIDAVDLWVERFESPTWLDYLRWRTRPTQSDQAVRERLLQLIVGEHVPGATPGRAAAGRAPARCAREPRSRRARTPSAAITGGGDERMAGRADRTVYHVTPRRTAFGRGSRMDPG